MKKVLYALSFFVASYTLYSCYSNPVTGRRTINLVDETSMRQMASTEYRSFLSTNRPVSGTRDAEMVQRVGSRIANAVNAYLASKGQSSLVSGYQWEFNLVNSNQANAWCMPGGKVAVYTGIMPIAQNEAGVAVIMGHEIAHAIAQHSNERMSQQMAAQGIGEALNVAMSTKSSATQQVFGSLFGVGAQVKLLQYGRNQESEADQMGLIFMAMAGYNPNEAINFWQRMSAQASGSKPPEFLSTHPSDARRISQIKGWIPSAMQHYKPQ
ncbi:MAG: M48 family peptidase [Sphingobacteriales bacterium]|nr:MAG: M48 family peptidase [Sphingobacteriales bacterium]